MIEVLKHEVDCCRNCPMLSTDEFHGEIYYICKHPETNESEINELDKIPIVCPLKEKSILIYIKN